MHQNCSFRFPQIKAQKNPEWERASARAHSGFFSNEELA